MYFNLKIHVAETNLTRILYDGLIEMLAGVTLGTSTRVWNEFVKIKTPILPLNVFDTNLPHFDSCLSRGVPLGM